MIGEQKMITAGFTDVPDDSGLRDKREMDISLGEFTEAETGDVVLHLRVLTISSECSSVVTELQQKRETRVLLAADVRVYFRISSQTYNEYWQRFCKLMFPLRLKHDATVSWSCQVSFLERSTSLFWNKHVRVKV